MQYANDELARAHDGQMPAREIIDGYLRYISWDVADDFPAALRLRQYPDIAPVIIDPRFGWGAPVLASTKVSVDTVVALWRAGEPLEVVAEEYGLTRDAVEAICRLAA